MFVGSLEEGGEQKNNAVKYEDGNAENFDCERKWLRRRKEYSRKKKILRFVEMVAM